MLNCINEKEIIFPIAYIGLEHEPEGNFPSICIEFNVSFKIFILAFLLSKIEISYNDKTDET